MSLKRTKLELTWIGKDERRRLEPRILLEDASLSHHSARRGTEDIFDNRLIFGDNLLALRALESEFARKVKCIYIDPPYNTGTAYEHYDDGREHSLWLSLMRDRLELLWRLLSPDGSIWISIDDDEMPYLRVVTDELFGRANFIAANVWQKRYSRENREAIGDVHEYILVYAVSPQTFKQTRNLVPFEAKQAKVYRNPNGDPRGAWRPIPMTAQEGHATADQFYEIISPSGKVFTPPKGRCWGIAKATFDSLLAEGRIYFGKRGDSQPNVIRYLDEVEGAVPWTWWPSEEVGHTDEAKKEMHGLFGKVDAFATPKPERLVRRILHIATNQGDLVLDSFAGSGTTAAVAHKMGRRWITIELGEHCHTHIIPRMKKVIDGEDQGGITEAVGWQGGGGFRYYRLAPSLLQKDGWNNWVINKEFNPEMLAEAVCKLENFTYQPSQEIWWQHGHSTERDFIYVTTQTLTQPQLLQISEDVGPDRSLLICCGSFRANAGAFPNLTIKKIPKTVMHRCEWGRDDYSLAIGSLPEPSPEQAPQTEARQPRKRAASRKATTEIPTLFALDANDAVPPTEE
jgi:adenine-specific DNA-methyltransferase